MTLSLTASNARIATVGRRFAAVALALAAVSGVATVSAATAASAATPGRFNSAQCDPNKGTVLQAVEAVRSYSTEYVMVQGALVNRATGATTYSQWGVGNGVTAANQFFYTGVARGEYNVYYQWASWDYSRSVYVYSGWYTTPTLWTFGRETYSGSRIYLNSVSGRCLI